MRGRESNEEAREAGEIPPSHHGNGGGRGYHPSRGGRGRFDVRGGRGSSSRGFEGRGRHSARGFGGRDRRADGPPFRGGRVGGRGRDQIDNGRGSRGRGRDGRGRMDQRGSGRNPLYNEYPRSRAMDNPRRSNGSYETDRLQHRDYGTRDQESTNRPAPVVAIPQRPRAPSNGSEGEILSESELTPPPPGGNNANYSFGPPPNAIRVEHNRRPSPDDTRQRWNDPEDRDGRRDDGRQVEGRSVERPLNNDRFQNNDQRPSYLMDNRPTIVDNRPYQNELPADRHTDRRQCNPPDLPAVFQRPPIQQHEPAIVVSDRFDQQQSNRPSHNNMLQSMDSPTASPAHNSPRARDTFSRGGRGVRMHGAWARGRDGRGYEVSGRGGSGRFESLGADRTHGKNFELREPRGAEMPHGQYHSLGSSSGRGTDHHRAPGRSFEGRGREPRRAPGPGCSFEGRGREHNRLDTSGRGFEGRGRAPPHAPGFGRGFEGRGRENRDNIRSDMAGRSLGGRGFEGRGRFGSIPGGREGNHGLEGRGFPGRGGRAMGGRPIGGGVSFGGRMERGREDILGGRGNDRPWDREDHFRPISPRLSSHEPQRSSPYQDPRRHDSRRSDFRATTMEQESATRSFASLAVNNDLINAKSASSKDVGDTSAQKPSPLPVVSISAPLPTLSSFVEAKVDRPVETSRPEPKQPPKPETPPPTPPPEPSAPSAYMMALTRLAEVEAQMEFEFAKLTRVSMKRQLVRAELDTLSSLPVGRPAFQEDYEKYLAEHGIDETAEEEKVDGITGDMPTDP